MVRHLIMAKRKLLLLSSSKVHGHDFLHHTNSGLESFLKKNDIDKILFIPFAAPPSEYSNYAKNVSNALSKFGCQTTSIHEFGNIKDGIDSAECIFIGGGNSFLLLKTLYESDLIPLIRKKVLNHGIPYIGSSAGSNVATRSIQTSNDMPIIYPPSFTALELIPFNINPHYIDPDPKSTHKGETRIQRISEFHHLNNAPVLGLPEGTSLLVDDDCATLLGDFNAKIFQKGAEPQEIIPGTDLSDLLKWKEYSK